MDSWTTVKALSALAQETRLAIFRLLVEQGPSGLTPGVIAEKLGLAPATLSFHLKELAHACLIRARQESRFIHYSADFEIMNGLVDYLTENCCRVGGCCDPACASVPPARHATSGSIARKARATQVRRRTP